MDPTVTLEKLRNAIAELRLLSDAEEAIPASLGDEVSNIFEDLDGWMSRGGFRPMQWDLVPPAGEK